MLNIQKNSVRRCERCNHLFNARLQACPYCHHTSASEPPADEPVAEAPVAVEPDAAPAASVSAPAPPAPPVRQCERKPLSKRQKRGVLSAILVAGLLLIGFFGWKMWESRHRLDTSVFETLPAAEVDRLVAKDPNFARVYEASEAIRHYITTAEERQTYKEITYARLQDYLSYYQSETFASEQRDKALQRYEQQVRQPMMPKFLEEKKKWDKFLREHDPAQYLIVSVITSYYSDGWSTHPAWHFSLSMPKGRLNDAQVDYGFVQRDADSLLYNGNMFSASLLDLEQTKADSKRYLTYVFDENFWDTHMPRVVVKSVTLSDRTVISLADREQVPATMLAYMADANANTECAVIKDLVDANYQSVDEYAYAETLRALGEKDKLCHELVQKVQSVAGGAIGSAVTPPSVEEALEEEAEVATDVFETAADALDDFLNTDW